MMILSLALLTIPTDFKQLMQILQYQLIINGVMTDDVNEEYIGVSMYVLGGILMSLSLPLLPLYLMYLMELNFL